ncbi:TPA: SMP-30/gluconolactonase/LRE family protein [Klebsiella pneumoniae]|nr:SMP-30/gluconolactonase/LRE family protein [Klebsiella pneumoniae]
MNGLNHNALTCSAVPIPHWERSLQTVEAQPYFNVSQASLVLEGIVFDQFTGPAPDGARVDSEGNVYVVISGQGRVMVFNRNGLPIGQIVLPDRDKGRNLKSTSLAIRPGHRELFIVANSGTEPGGAMIFL